MALRAFSAPLIVMTGLVPVIHVEPSVAGW